MLNIVKDAPKTLEATSGQFSSMRFKSSSVQSRSKTVFWPSAIALHVLLSSSSSSSSSLSLSGPMLTCPKKSAGEKAETCSAWVSGAWQLSCPHNRLSRLPIYTNRGRKKKVLINLKMVKRSWSNFEHYTSHKGY